MEITLHDGISNKLLNLLDFTVRPIVLRQHAMRYHIYDPLIKVATVQFHTKDRDLRRKIVRVARRRHGKIWTVNTWIDIVNKDQELWNASRYRRMVQRDLEGWWGEDFVQVTGTSIRTIYYVTDGSASGTPEMIGMHRKRPLIYYGRAIGTIFKINGIDVLSPDNCVVYWLPRSWWDSFHSRYKKNPVPFPGNTGFVVTNWCQRAGHAKYGSGIWLASLNQGQSVGGWSAGQLVRYWRQYQSKDITHGTPLTLAGNLGPRRSMAKLIKVQAHLTWLAKIKNAPYGNVGMYCLSCGKLLESPYSECHQCGKCNCPSCIAYYKKLCTGCGLPEIKCECKDPTLLFFDGDSHNIQYNYLF